MTKALRKNDFEFIVALNDGGEARGRVLEVVSSSVMWHVRGGQWWCRRR